MKKVIKKKAESNKTENKQERKLTRPKVFL